ncbi:MAG TPA: helix-turn-helix transcriptional regulator [Bryobacteraceae bacterium]|nr:helix-turn-helix transcriptional regulator [Bryobacteraceae bacterium]
MASHIGKKRLKGLSDSVQHDLISMRYALGWSQAELGRRVGLSQVHISGIETGKVVLRFHTLLELVRVLEYEPRHSCLGIALR